jgi:hypothetical protein
VGCLDTWLNGLRGWRLALLCWIAMSPSLLASSLGVWNMFGPSPETAVSAFEVGACAILATLPIAILAAMVQDRLGDRRTALFSWRLIVGWLLLPGAMILLGLPADLAGWSHYRGIIGAVSLPMLLVGTALVLAGLFRIRRLRRGAHDGGLLPPR